MFFFCFEDCVIPLKQVYAHTKVYWAYSQVVYFGLLKLLRHTHPICDYLLKRLLPILSIFGIYPVFMICKPDISTIPILLHPILWYVSLAFVIISSYCFYFNEFNTLLELFQICPIWKIAFLSNEHLWHFIQKHTKIHIGNLFPMNNTPTYILHNDNNTSLYIIY